MLFIDILRKDIIKVDAKNEDNLTNLIHLLEFPKQSSVY